MEGLGVAWSGDTIHQTQRSHAHSQAARLRWRGPLTAGNDFSMRRFPRFIPLFLAAILGLALHAGEPATGGWLLVANKGDRTLAIVDPVAGKVVAAVAEDGVTGHEVAASPDGRFAYVPIFGDSGVGRPGTDGRLVRVIDINQRKVVGTVDFGKGVRPHCAVFGPKNGRLYVTTELDNSVSIIDPATLKVVGAIPTGQPESHMLAITRDGRRGYTSNVGSGTVSVLDLEANKLITTIAAAPRAQRISLSVDDRLIFTADQTKPQLVVIDTATNGVRQRIDLPGHGYGTAPTPDGRWLLVALNRINKVAFVDLQSFKVALVLDVPKSPQAILVQPDGTAAYVACDASRQVAVIDVKAQRVTKLIETGAGTDGLAWTRKN